MWGFADAIADLRSYFAPRPINGCRQPTAVGPARGDWRRLRASAINPAQRHKEQRELAPASLTRHANNRKHLSCACYKMDTITGNTKFVCTVALAGAAAVVLLKPRAEPKKHAHGGACDDALQRVPNHSVMRLAAIANGGASDHALATALSGGEVALVYNEDFSLDSTIFASLDSKLNRMIMQCKLGSQPFWSDAAQVKVRAAYSARLGPPPTIADPALTAIFNFMEKECDFACEHADGYGTIASLLANASM